MYLGVETELITSETVSASRARKFLALKRVMSHNRDMGRAKDWVDRLIGGASIRSVAIDAGIAPATLARQYTADNLQPDTIVSIARHYRRSPIEGLVALDLVSETEVAHMEVSLALRAASDVDIVDEVLRRIRANPESELNQPVTTRGESL